MRLQLTDSDKNTAHGLPWQTTGRRLGVARNHSIRDAESGRVASYRDFEFLEVSSGGIDCICAVKLQSLSQRDFQRLEQFLSARFLTIDAETFFDPSDPPMIFLVHDGCVVTGFHFSISIFSVPGNTSRKFIVQRNIRPRIRNRPILRKRYGKRSAVANSVRGCRLVAVRVPLGSVLKDIGLRFANPTYRVPHAGGR